MFSTDESKEVARAARQAVDRAVAVLVHPDDHVRREAVGTFMRLSHRIVRERLLDRLIKLLTANDDGVRRRATESLVDAGAYAVSWLTYRLGKARRPDVQIRLAEVVARAGRQVDPLHAMIFRPALELVRQKTRHEEVRAAVTRAMEELGSTYGVPGQTGPEGITSPCADRRRAVSAGGDPATAATDVRANAM
jgi:hypothetical protein